MPYSLGIDVSTTATKALLIDQDGDVVATASTRYRFESPHPLWSEQDPSLWWTGAMQSVRSVIDSEGIDAAEIKAIGLTGQMHGLVALDSDARILRPAILWNDQRTAAECDAIRNLVGKEKLVAETGNNALTGFTAPKILWMRNNEPDLYKRTSKFLLPKDYLRYRLTNEFATDKAGAAGTLLFDLRERNWSARILDLLKIDRDLLPDTFEGPEVTGTVTEEASKATGLAVGTPVVAGGGDQAAQGVGVGAVRSGILALTVGTSGVVFGSTDKPLIEPEGRMHSFCHAVPGKWHLMGVMLSAAGSLAWFRDALAANSSFDEIVDMASEIAPAANGLLFLPYLTGERTPHADPLARGSFIGLTVRHGKGHLVRAVLEGVAFGLKDNLAMMSATGMPEITEIRISGGGAKSRLWRSILADVLQKELTTVNTTEGAAYGAAILAGVAAGFWESVEEACDAIIRVTGAVEPGLDNRQRYDDSYALFREAFTRVQPMFERLSRLESATKRNTVGTAVS